MKPVINETIRKDGNKNQLKTNIIYEQKLVVHFLKTINSQIKWHHNYTKKVLQ